MKQLLIKFDIVKAIISSARDNLNLLGAFGISVYGLSGVYCLPSAQRVAATMRKSSPEILLGGWPGQSKEG